MKERSVEPSTPHLMQNKFERNVPEGIDEMDVLLFHCYR